MADRVAVDRDEEVAPGIDAEEGSADGLVRDGQLDLPGPAPVAVDVVGQRGKPLFRDAPVLLPGFYSTVPGAVRKRCTKGAQF